MKLSPVLKCTYAWNEIVKEKKDTIQNLPFLQNRDFYSVVHFKKCCIFQVLVLSHLGTVIRSIIGMEKFLLVLDEEECIEYINLKI